MDLICNEILDVAFHDELTNGYWKDKSFKKIIIPI